MSVHKYTSWGRTRRPKNITGIDGTQVIGTTIAALTALDIANTGSNAKPANGVYKTENQRYLIVQLSVYNTSFKVQGYMHASGAWADIKASPTINDVGIWTVEISGIDQVRFVTTGNCTVFAACSTF